MHIQAALLGQVLITNSEHEDLPGGDAAKDGRNGVKAAGHAQQMYADPVWD